jgi:lysophospholipase L1-like esterase
MSGDNRAGRRTAACGPRRRRGGRFLAFVVLANLLAFAACAAGGELAVRWWREGSLRAAIASLGAQKPMPRNLGTGDWLQADPTRGYVLRAGVHGTNSLHIRHPELAAPKPEQVARLLVLGDSVAYPADGFVARIREAAAAAPATMEVVNAATPGYTTHQERLHLEALLGAVAPDAVLLQYCCNDNHLFLHHLTAEGAWLITEEARRALLPENGGLLARIARWSYLALEVRRLLYANRPKNGLFPWRDDPAFAAAWRDDSWPLVEREILRIRDVAAAVGARFAVVAVPYEPQIAESALAADRAQVLMPQLRLEALCARGGIAFLDLHGAFVAARDRGLFSDGIHLTPAGHEVAAVRLVPFLRANGLLR